MPRSWQHPRWRRLLMQSAMWIILGGTMALAEMIDRHKHLAREVPLGPAVECGPVSLQLPVGWNILADAPQLGMLSVRGPIVHKSQRTLLVTALAGPMNNGMLDQLLRQPTPHNSPNGDPTAENLRAENPRAENPRAGRPRNGVPRSMVRELPMQERDREEETVVFGPDVGSLSAAGLLIVRENTIDNDDGEAVPVRRQVIASATMPSGAAVTLRLNHVVHGVVDLGDAADDVELVKRIAATVKND